MHRISVPWPEIEPMPLAVGAWILATGLPGKSPQSGVSQFSSVQSLSHVQLCDPMDCSMSRFPVLHWVCSNSCSMNQWYHPFISSSIASFSSCPQSFPALGSFPMSQFFASGGQSIGVSASTSILPMNIQDWFLLGLTGCISLQSKGLSRVFSNTTVQKHQFFGAQLSSQSNSHIYIWLLGKP